MRWNKEKLILESGVLTGSNGKRQKELYINTAIWLVNLILKVILASNLGTTFMQELSKVTKF
jgi:hypothetical protein